VSLASPTQSLPPYRGCRQVRWRCCSPLLHDLLQSDQALHGPHSPSTSTVNTCYLVHTTDTDMYCLVNRIGDNSRLLSVVLNIVETVRFCPVLSEVSTRLQTSPSCKLEKQNSVHTAFRDWAKQFRNFLSPTVLTCREFCSHS